MNVGITTNPPQPPLKTLAAAAIETAAMDPSAATREALMNELLAERAEHQLAIERIDALIAKEEAEMVREFEEARRAEVSKALLKLHGDDGEVVREKSHRVSTSSGYATVNFNTTVAIAVGLNGGVYTVYILLTTSDCGYSGGGTDSDETPEDRAVRFNLPLDDFIAKLSTGRLDLADKFEDGYGPKADCWMFETELEDLFKSLVDSDDSDSD